MTGLRADAGIAHKDFPGSQRSRDHTPTEADVAVIEDSRLPRGDAAVGLYELHSSRVRTSRINRKINLSPFLVLSRNPQDMENALQGEGLRLLSDDQSRASPPGAS